MMCIEVATLSDMTHQPVIIFLFLSLEQMLTTTPFFLVVVEASSTFSIRRLLKLYVYRFMYHISSVMLTTHESTHRKKCSQLLQLRKCSSSQLLKLLTTLEVTHSFLHKS